MIKQSFFISVLNRGEAGELLKEMRVLGLEGGVIMLGEGTASSRLLRIFGLEETQKDVIFLPAIEEKYENAVHELMLNHFRLDKRRKGIAFSIPLTYFQHTSLMQEREIYDPACFQYQCIFVIVDAGKGKDVIQKAREVGQFGGTILHGRGAGVPADSYFPFNIEPQKDVVMLLTKSELTHALQEQLFQALHLEQPGSGIMFALPVSKVTGIFMN